MLETASIADVYADLGFAEAPFNITPDTAYFFPGSQHGTALTHLQYGLASGGFTMLTGEVGLGKTLLCRTLLRSVPAGVRTAYIFNPPPTLTEFLHSIHLDLTGRAMTSTSYGECLKTMHQTLLTLASQGEKVAVLVDEAHRMTGKLLEGLRLLSNLETEKEKLIFLLLVGQPELEETLRHKLLRPLAQRISIRYKLAPFTAAETRSYVQHRLDVARLRGSFAFSGMALYLVHRLSGGAPRRINQICDRALLAAWAEGKEQVGSRTLLRAAREVREGNA